MKSIMYQFLLLLVPYVKKTTLIWKTIFSKKGFFLLTPAVIVLPTLTLKQHIGLFLFALMIFDFATGVAVSNKQKKEAEKLHPELKKQHLISSEGLKRTGVKFLLYFSTIAIAYWSENVLKLNTFNISFSQIEFTVTIAVMLWWITVETYSIVFENFKKLGFDVFSAFNKIIDTYKNGKSKINE